MESMDIAQYETKIRRLSQHFTIMDDNIENIVLLSDTLKTEEMKKKLEILHLKQLLNSENVFGFDAELMSDCDKSVKWMIKSLMNRWKLHKHELLFVGHVTNNLTGVCEIYDVSTKYKDVKNDA